MGTEGWRMAAFVGTEPHDEVALGWWHRPSATRLLLIAAVPAVVVYAIGDVLSGLFYDGYSCRIRRSVS